MLLNDYEAEILSGLKKLGVKEKMELEVHSSLSSFGFVDGGAIQVIDALKEAVTKVQWG